ncbi:MAG TPA: PAS domain-containing protein, partial [Flavisolibacter sp.]|nr:PAS domain-containing protein [Flavisolibacter sp.]
MQIKADTEFSIQNLTLLSSYAQFLLSHRLEEYVREQVWLSRQYQLPLLKYFSQMTDEDLIELARESSREFLTYLANNNARLQIEKAIQNWVSNQLPDIDKMDVTAEDITLANFIRKRSLLKFIAEYCRDAEQIIELIKEIDLYILESETAFTNTFLRLLHQDIEEHSLLLQKINNTIPGAVYVFDVEAYKNIYSNNKLPEIIGYNHEELNALYDRAIDKLVHPDDRPGLFSHIEELKKIGDGTIKIIKYRILTKQGNYKWICAYETVFKKRENGTIWQTIGILLDIDKEQKVNEEIKEWEQRLQEAQEMANMGSFYWDFASKEMNGTAKAFSILETAPQNIEDFYQKVHPEDLDKVGQELSRAF